MDTELTLWGASVKAFPLAERIEAARAGGFTAVSVFPYEVNAAAAAGLDPRGFRERFEDQGLRIAVVDPLTTWLPESRVPDDLPPEDPATGALAPTAMFELATALGADVVTALALFDDLVEPVSAAAAFASVCDRAAERDLRLALEFIPGSGIPDLRCAWEIVRRSDRANGGLMLDSWHFFRSDPDFELLAAIPPDRVFAIQLDDAPAEPAADLAHESLHERLIPGDGELDLARFTRILLDGGTPQLIGPEVFSDATAELPASQLGRLLGERTRELIGS
ncbi:MAG: sugar phosphate isomerase/epimerase family protein [Solirubrobacteraceae bacterium]